MSASKSSTATGSTSQTDETALPVTPHFIGGRPDPGTSARFGDVYDRRPAGGPARRPGERRRRRRGGRGGCRGVSRLGGGTALAPRPRAQPVPRPGGAEPPGARRPHHLGTRQGGVRRRRRGAARQRSRGVRDGHSAAAEGGVHRGGRHRRRRLFAAPAARRGRRHHAVQFPGDGADVDVPIALACGNTCARRARRTTTSVELAGSSRRPDCPMACSTSSTATEAVDAITDRARAISSSGRRRWRVHLRAGHRGGQARPGAWRANHMVVCAGCRPRPATDALVGAA